MVDGIEPGDGVLAAAAAPDPDDAGGCDERRPEDKLGDRDPRGVRIVDSDPTDHRDESRDDREDAERPIPRGTTPRSLEHEGS